jgi:hypothetical protein
MKKTTVGRLAAKRAGPLHEHGDDAQFVMMMMMMMMVVVRMMMMR